jgi:hypothetical protein
MQVTTTPVGSGAGAVACDSRRTSTAGQGCGLASRYARCGSTWSAAKAPTHPPERSSSTGGERYGGGAAIGHGHWDLGGPLVPWPPRRHYTPMLNGLRYYAQSGVEFDRRVA